MGSAYPLRRLRTHGVRRRSSGYDRHMASRRNESPEEEPVQELAEEIAEDNPDRTTRREALELELMDEGRSEEGADADLDEAEAQRSNETTRR